MTAGANFIFLIYAQYLGQHSLMDVSRAKDARRVSCSGQVSRVDAKFAYVTTARLGTVFVPPCSVLPPKCEKPFLTEFLKAGDVVHIVARPQENKNDCNWTAVKVSFFSNFFFFFVDI